MKVRIFYSCFIFAVVQIFFLFGPVLGQEENALFQKSPLDSFGIKCYKMICTKSGYVRIISSIGLLMLKGRHFDLGGIVTDNSLGIRNFRSYLAEDEIRAVAEGPDSLCYYATRDNLIFFTMYNANGYGWPPFYFPPKGQPNINVYSFAEDSTDKNIIWIGTDKGLFSYNKVSIETRNVFADTIQNITITHLQSTRDGNIWFSSLERGMGYYYRPGNSVRFYPYSKKEKTFNTLYPVKTFCSKTPYEFFVAVADSLPAIFNTKSRTYTFIDDSSLYNSANKTDDIAVDKSGNLFLIKDGILYYCKTIGNQLLATAFKNDSLAMAPFITGISFLNGGEIASEDHHPEYLKEVTLKHNQNNIVVYYGVNDYSNKIQFAWKIDGVTYGWILMPVLNIDNGNFATVQDLKPGKYILQVKVKTGNEDWRKQQAQLVIIITPPFWQTWWFWISVIAVVTLIVFAVVKWRENAVRKQERIKAKYEKEALELEAKALRAQMNPHFIFNCMNSIKSLIQQNDQDKAVTYLTTFSKLLRTVLHNCDKREITLFDELETSRLYAQLESMRFGEKLCYSFKVDETIDLKSIMVPALIVQPFIENAIWHGIMPKEEGGRLNVIIEKKNDVICCIIDDDGIGREMSKQNKFKGEPPSHQSKGVRLTQSRLDLDNLLNERSGTVEIIDKTDEDGKASGTKVVLTFKEF